MTTIYADGYFNYESTLDAWVTDLDPEDEKKAEAFLNPVPEGITKKLEVCKYRKIPSLAEAKCWK